MKFSSMAPFGQLRFSSKPSRVKILYDLLPSLWGSQIDFTEKGSYVETKRYCVARQLAACLAEVERAGNQFDPNKAVDLLPLLEIDFLATPGPNDTVPTRQAAVAAAMLLVQGAKASNVVGLLKAILGSAFVAYVPAPAGASPTVVPTNPGAGPGAFKDVRQPAKLLQLVDPAVRTGILHWCAYQALDTSSVPTLAWSSDSSFAQYQLVVPTTPNATGFFYQCSTAGTSDGTEPTWGTVPGQTTQDGSVVWTCIATIADALVPGDVVVVDAGNTKRMEPVQVVAVANTPPAGSNTTPGYLYFAAVFQNAHDVGAAMTTGNVPYWWSTQRTNLVVLSAAASVDQPTRRRVDALMAKVLRGVSTWAIVAADLNPPGPPPVTGASGPLSAGSPMGASPVGQITFPLSA